MTSFLDRVDRNIREYLMGHQSVLRTVLRILFGGRHRPEPKPEKYLYWPAGRTV